MCCVLFRFCFVFVLVLLCFVLFCFVFFFDICFFLSQFGYEEFLSGLVAKACTSVLSADGSFNVDNVRTCKILGGGVIESTLVK